MSFLKSKDKKANLEIQSYRQSKHGNLRMGGFLISFHQRAQII
jgi:hypothetical protein